MKKILTSITFSLVASLAYADQSFQLLWSGAGAGNTASASGTLTLNNTGVGFLTSNYASSPGSGDGATLGISAFKVTITGSSSGNGAFSMPTSGNSFYMHTPGALNLSQQLIGQTVGGQIFGTRNGVSGDFNYFGSAPSAPSGSWFFTLTTASGEDMYLISWLPYNTISAQNTLYSVQENAAGLATTYNVQAAALQAGLTYDCNTFDQYGLCASVGGRTTYGLTTPVGNQQAGLLIVSHRPDPHFRFGAFADQSVNSAMPNGIKQNNSGPMYGIFGYWNHQKDGMGLGASVSATAANSNLTVTRNASLANTEAGSGNTEMQGQAVQAQGTYAFQATERIKAIPYAGLRYYRVATGGYSEGSNANVTSPLTYNAMAQEVFAAVGGVGTSVFLAEKLTGTVSVGIQQNLNYKMGNYQGTSTISGLESFSVNMPSNINSMATATAGMSYAVKKNEKIGVNVLWQQQAFMAANTITALATYSIGF